MEASQETITEFNNNDDDKKKKKKITVIEKVVKIKYTDILKVKLIHMDDSPPLPSPCFVCSCNFFLESRP